MANAHQDPHNNPQQPQQQVEDPHNPGFDLQGNPMQPQQPDNYDDHAGKQPKKKSNLWLYILIAAAAILLLIIVMSLFKANNERHQDEATPEQPELTTPVDSTDIKRAEEAEARAKKAEEAQAELAKQVAHLDSLTRGLIPNPNLQQPAQPGNGGITQPGNGGQQQPGNGGTDVPTIPGLTVIETCLTARPAVGVVYWCRDTKEFQYRKSQKLQLPGKEWPK